MKIKRTKICVLFAAMVILCTLSACSKPTTEDAGGQMPPTSAVQTESATADNSASTPTVSESVIPLIPANAEVVYENEEYIITKKELFTHHIARQDIGDYQPVAMPGFDYYYSDGLLCIISVSDRLYGYADKNGNVVIPCQYEEAKYFSEGLAAVKTYNEWTGGYAWGFINTAGEMVIPAEYDAVNSFSDGLAAANNGNGWGYVDATGKETIPFGKYVGVYEAGHGTKARDFHDGLAYTSYEADGGLTNYCFINKTGEIAIDMSEFEDRGYSGAWDFENGLARIGHPNNSVLGAFGYMDTTGNIVIALPEDIKQQRKTLSDFYESYAIINMSGDKSYVIDGSGNTVFSLAGKGMKFLGNDYRFREGLMPVIADASGKYGFIDTSGEMVIPFIFDVPPSGFQCGLSAINTTGMAQTGYIDRTGNIILSLPTPQGGGVGYGDFYEDSAIVFSTESNGVSTTYLLEIVRK